MANPIIGITITLHQTAIAAEFAGVGMLTYGAFEIHATKMRMLAQIRTPLVYYKPNEWLTATIKFLCTYSPKGRIQILSGFLMRSF